MSALLYWMSAFTPPRALDREVNRANPLFQGLPKERLCTYCWDGVEGWGWG